MIENIFQSSFLISAILYYVIYTIGGFLYHGKIIPELVCRCVLISFLSSFSVCVVTAFIIIWSE